MSRQPEPKGASSDAKRLEIRHGYMPARKVRSSSNLPSLAKQSFKDECDINNILAKYRKTGLVTHLAKYGGNYNELPLVDDYHDALNQILAAKDAFLELPAEMRKFFNNDPAEFLDFVNDPENVDAMIDMGLAIATPETPAEGSSPASVGVEEVVNEGAPGDPQEPPAQ